MKIVQVALRHENEDHSFDVLTTWVDKKNGLKEGSIISLKDHRPDIEWVVARLYENEHDAHDFDFHHGWDNNNYEKHMGLKI